MGRKPGGRGPESGGRKPGGRTKRTPSPEWLAFLPRLIHPDQIAYEEVRPVVALGQEIKARAAELGVSERTLSRRVERFVQRGIPGLLATAPHRPDDRRHLPQPIRDAILQLKAEHPPFTPREIADVIEVRFERRVGHHTVERVLAHGVLPRLTRRRFPRYARLPTTHARRDAILRLHLDGWSTPAIIAYLHAPRRTVYAFLQRWASDTVVKRLGDRKRGPHPGGRKVTLPVVAAVKALQEETAIGEFRMAAALKQQYGIELSPRTCGRIMAKNRDLYGIGRPQPAAEQPAKRMPFATRIPHRWWSVDLCYIEQHRLPDVEGPVYIWTILDNASRAIIASAPSKTQDLWAFLQVLFTGIHVYGAPIGLVSDGGGVFKATVALDLYARLGIEKDQIARRQAWQNYVESHFLTMKHMERYRLERATTWEEFCAIHARFVADFNHQAHFAHVGRADGRRTPAEVLGEAKGRRAEVPTLRDVFEVLLARRTVDPGGYVRYANWRIYGAEGLANHRAGVWLAKETRTLTLAYDGLPVTQYAVTFAPDASAGMKKGKKRKGGKGRRERKGRKTIAQLRERYTFPSPLPSLHRQLWDEETMSALEWRKVYRLPQRRARRLVRGADTVQIPLFAPG